MERRKFLSLLSGGVGLLLVSPVSAQDKARESLLSEEERKNFRDRMRNSGNKDERRRIQEEHNELVRQRAKERGRKRGKGADAENNGGREDKKARKSKIKRKKRTKSKRSKRGRK